MRAIAAVSSWRQACAVEEWGVEVEEAEGRAERENQHERETIAISHRVLGDSWGTSTRGTATAARSRRSADSSTPCEMLEADAAAEADLESAERQAIVDPTMSTEPTV